MEWFGYSQGSILAPDGRSKPFEASADGYVTTVEDDTVVKFDIRFRFSRAEGVGAVVLKPLDAANRDGDYIYGTVR